MTYRSPMVLTCMPKPLTRAIPRDERDKDLGMRSLTFMARRTGWRGRPPHDERFCQLAVPDALGDGLQLVHSLDRGALAGKARPRKSLNCPMTRVTAMPAAVKPVVMV